LATLRNLQIPLPNDRTVPLSQIASFDFGQEYPMIWQRDRIPTLKYHRIARNHAEQ
jgi:multidrug efflux pump